MQEESKLFSGGLLCQRRFTRAKAQGDWLQEPRCMQNMSSQTVYYSPENTVWDDMFALVLLEMLFHGSRLGVFQ